MLEEERTESAAMLVRKIRLEKSISQRELAERAGMRPAQLCKIEAGRNGLTESTLARLATALDVSVSTLFGEKSRKAPSRVERTVKRDAEADCLVPVMVGIDGGVGLSALAEELSKREREIEKLERAKNIAGCTSLQLVYPYGGDENAAELISRDVRASLGLGSQPVFGFAAALERAGVRVMTVDRQKAFQSASFFNPSHRLLTIVVNVASTEERNRYRMVYEVGAAVRFASTGFRTFADDGAAHRFLRTFTAAFLMPEDAVRAEVALLGIRPDEWTMNALVFEKERFGVSAETFALRLESLGLITPALRHSLRDALRERYKTHPSAMEPHPPRGQKRWDVLRKLEKSVRLEK